MLKGDFLILWGASGTETQTARARISNPVSGGRAISFIHPPHEVLLARFSLYVHKGGLKPHSFQR